MQNPDQDEQDQRNSGMEDSTAKTIEFLRARLHAERSVSKTARQRANELAERVMELEEQLRIVSIQRKKAERATADVLAILETRGIVSDFSEDYYSSSDQEATSCDDPRKGEVSVNSKLRGPDSEELSGTEHDSSTISGRSLSWKGRKGSSRSLEKYKDSSIKRRSSFSSAMQPSKHRPGKSCRQIKRREQRFESTGWLNESVNVNYQKSEAATSPERSPRITDIRHETYRETTESQEDEVLQRSLGPDKLEDDSNKVNNSHKLKAYGGETDMERALERQAQLIGQYEAMEKAQREWEERFGENNNSAPDSCDPGSYSDITEERDEIKSQAPCPPGSVPGVQEVNSRTEDACDRLSGTQPDSLPQILKGGQPLGGHTHPYDHPDKSHDVAMSSEKPNQDGAENSYRISSQRTHNDTTLLQSSHQISSVVVDTCQEADSGRQTENFALVPQETGVRLGDVLGALQQVKSMLQKKMSSGPIAEGGSVGKVTEPYLPGSDRMEKLDIPAGCPGLFRIPTDFPSETIKSDYRSSTSRLSLTSHHPKNGATSAMDTRYLTHPYMESRAGLPFFVGNPMIDAGSRTRTPQLQIDPYSYRTEPPPYTPPYMDRTMPPRHTPSLSYPDLVPRAFASDGFSRTLSSSCVRTLPSDLFLFHDGSSRPNMYR